MSETADVSEPSVTPSVNASKGKTAEPPLIPEKPINVNVSSGADVDVRESYVEDGDVFEPAVADTITKVIPEEVGPKKKFKKRKHKKSVDAGESFKLKKKLSKEEKAAKKARKAERRATRAAQEAADAEAEEDDVPEEVRPSVPQPDNEDILTTDDTKKPSSKVITISPKLMEGIHVADVPLAHVADKGASGSDTDGIA
ncbi:hypothetical protein LIER_16867 [Lithospermum erythrorhizon]|uniref:Uncharacterized protein n=1 Tax=Lithospermum erythrorhizon TaxID=34254 RepID=A0AAV3QCD6_LITER